MRVRGTFRRSELIRAGRAYPRNGDSVKSRASRSTPRITRGSCTGRIRYRTMKRICPHLRWWDSTAKAISAMPGADPAQATSGRSVSTACKSITRASSGSPATTARQPTSAASDPSLTIRSSNSHQMANSSCRSGAAMRAAAMPTRSIFTSRRTQSFIRRPMSSSSPMATEITASQSSTLIQARSNACGAHLATCRRTTTDARTSF